MKIWPADQVTEEQLVAFLKEEREHGYASGRPREVGPYHGSKTFGVYVSKDGQFSAQDTYGGRGQSGGFYWICTEKPERRPYMLIQYGGGCPQTLSGDFVGDVNDFLKRALFHREEARLPQRPGNKPFWVQYTEEGNPLAYLGIPNGSAYNLTWLEGIFDISAMLDRDWKEQFGLNPKDPIVDPLEMLIEQAAAIFDLGKDDPNLIFYHDLKHRLLR